MSRDEDQERALQECVDKLIAAAATAARDAAEAERAHLEAVHHLRHAIETRDLIGQAKGLLMARSGCTADDAFDLLRAQSQHENLKLVEIAQELVIHHERRCKPSVRS